MDRIPTFGPFFCLVARPAHDRIPLPSNSIKAGCPCFYPRLLPLPKCICAAICLLLLLHVRASFRRPFGLSSHGSRTEENSRAEADTIRSLFQGISFSFLLSILIFPLFSSFVFFAVPMSMFFLCLCGGEDDSVCLVSAARSFFWSCALWLNVSCLLEVFAIAVGLFLYYRVGS